MPLNVVLLFIKGVAMNSSFLENTLDRSKIFNITKD